MKLQEININEDKSLEQFSSDDCQNLISIYNEYYPKVGFHKPWIGYFIIRENEIVGSCGFTGSPKAGKVEIAYWTFRNFEGQGVASFACKELILISQKTDPSVFITAKTAPEHNASTKVLQNNGFAFSRLVTDEEIGDAWLWEWKASKGA